jgi:hypothetical protein
LERISRAFGNWSPRPIPQRRENITLAYVARDRMDTRGRHPTSKTSNWRPLMTKTQKTQKTQKAQKTTRRIWRVICLLGNRRVAGSCGHSHRTLVHAMRCSYEPKAYRGDSEARLIARPLKSS